MCKEFSGPSSCCFSCSHKLCCSGRRGALICSQILWGFICAGWCCREHGCCVKYIPKPEQPRWDYFREGSGCSSLTGRWVFAQPLVMAPSCYSQELRVGHPRSRLWQRDQLWTASLEKLPWWRDPGPSNSPPASSSNCTWCNLCLDLSVYFNCPLQMCPIMSWTYLSSQPHYMLKNEYWHFTKC